MSYIERETAIKYLKGECIEKYPSTFWAGITASANEISKMPTADVVEVVRCKDCKRCDHCYPMKNKGEEAKEGYYCDYNKRYVKPNDYCSYGERSANDGT